MTITQSTLYWVTRCDGFSLAGLIFSVLFGFGTVFSTMYLLFEESKMFAKFVWFICVAGLISSVATALLVPTTKEMAAIIVIPELANSKTVKELGDGVVTLAREWIEELKPNKKGEADGERKDRVHDGVGAAKAAP